MVQSIFSILFLFELDVAISKTLAFGVSGNLSAQDVGSSLAEMVVEVLDSDAGVKVLNEDVGFWGEVSDVSLEHYSNVFSANLLVLGILTGRFSISWVKEVDVTESSGFTSSRVSHDSDKVERSEL